MPPCVEITNLYKTYNRGKTHVLDNVSLQINAGEIFGLIGPNGAGKTTLMTSMLALTIPNAGLISINGFPAANLGNRRVTGFLPERPHFDAWMTVEQFLHYHHELAGLSTKEAEANVNDVLTKVELEFSVKKRLVRRLSRGMLQRLGLAQVLIGRPEICFLDEPASGMDPLGVQLIRQLLLEWKKAGTTVVLNSHHLDEVEKTCDRIAFMKDGKIRFIEELTNIQQNKQHLTIKWHVDTDVNKNIQAILDRTASNLNTSYTNAGDNKATFAINEIAAPYKIISDLVGQGLEIEEAMPQKHSLEELFRDLSRNLKENEHK